MVNLSNPVLIAVLIGWVLTVVLHELAHGVVAYLGGDYTIRERGGLTLNPLQYVHPVNSLLLPAVFLMMGGVPLPGGATYVRRDLLRNRAWESAVSLAGPATNLALFFLLLLPLHPYFGWVTADTDPKAWTGLQQFFGALGELQLLTAVFNLIPIPPLDGFNAIAPFLGRDVQAKTGTPAAANVGLVFVFVLLQSAHTETFRPVFRLKNYLLDHVGMADVREGIRVAFNDTIAG